MTYPTISLGKLCIDRPQYGANAKAITRTSASQPRYIRITDIDANGQLIPNGVAADVSDTSTYLLREGDLLIARSGNTVGKSYLHPKGAEPSLFAGYLIRFQLSPNRINPRFAFFFTKSERYNSWLDSKRRVAGQPNINGTEYASLEIPLPPLPEQARIVEILDQAGTLRQQRRQADALSQRILPALFHEMFGRSEFPVVSVGDLASSERNSIRTGPFGSQLLHSEFSDEGEVAVLGIDNVVTNDFRWDKPRFISSNRYEALRRYTVHPRDILVTIMGTCGRCAIAPADLPTAINTKHLCCITLDQSKCLPEFLHAAFLFDSQLRNHLGAREKGAVMPGLNMGVIKSAPVNLPPMAVQRKFANAATAMDQPRQSASTSAATLETLFQTLLHRAFDGSLTAKWREGQAKELLQEMEHQAR